MKKTMICIVTISLVIFFFWMFIAYKAQPLILLFWGDDIAQSMYSEEFEWMQGKSVDEIEDRFGPFDVRCWIEGDGYYLGGDRVLICDASAPEIRYICGECNINNRSGVFSLEKDFPRLWMLSNLCASLLVCGGVCSFSAVILLRRKKKKAAAANSENGTLAEE